MSDPVDSGTRMGDGEELEIATEADFGITRNEDGELTAVKQRVPGTDKAIKVKPLSSGDLDEYISVLESAQAEDEEVAEVIHEHVEEGFGLGEMNLAETVTWVENAPGYLISGIVQALKDSSGHDVFLATQERRNEQLKQNAELLRALGSNNGENPQASESGLDMLSSSTEN